MRKCVVAAAMAGCAFVSTAEAGDRWSGFYVGGNAGHALANVKTTDSFLDTSGPALGIGPGARGRFPGENSDGSLDGFIGGGQVGYNYQSGIYVLGVEADIQAGDLKDSDHFLGSPFGPTFDTTAKIEYFGTVRAKAGIVVDGLLVYATGGFAYGEGKGTLTDTPGAPGVPPAPAFAGPYSGSDTQSHTGWVLGGGAEIPVTSSVSIKAEFMHVDLSEETYRFNLAGTPDGSFSEASESISLDVLRTGVNFRF